MEKNFYIFPVRFITRNLFPGKMRDRGNGVGSDSIFLKYSCQNVLNMCINLSPNVLTKNKRVTLACKMELQVATSRHKLRILVTPFGKRWRALLPAFLTRSDLA